MNISLDPAIMEALKSLAAKLGTTVEFLLAVTRRQTTILAFTNILLFFICAGLFYGAIRWFQWTRKRGSWATDPHYVGCAVLGIWSFVMGVDFVMTFARYFLNPDYYAIKLLFEMLGK